MWFRRTCKEAVALMVAREDRALATSEQMALRMHLWACKACPKFDDQMRTVHNAMQQWRAHNDAQIDDRSSPS